MWHEQGQVRSQVHKIPGDEDRWALIVLQHVISLRSEESRIIYILVGWKYYCSAEESIDKFDKTENHLSGASVSDSN